MQYRYKSGSSITGVSAQQAGEELSRIAERDGEVKASVLVSESRPKEAPLHPAFTWDNKKAADLYRLEEARRVIRLVRVIDSHDNHQDEPILVHVPCSESPRSEGSYKSPHVIVKDYAEYQRALTAAQEKVSAAQRAISDLKKIAEHSENNERLASLTLAIESLSIARNALRMN